MSDVYVLGVDMIKFGRFPDRTVPNIGAEAALMALDDAGLTIKDMQALYCGNLGQANAMVGQILGILVNYQMFIMKFLCHLMKLEDMIVLWKNLKQMKLFY